MDWLSAVVAIVFMAIMLMIIYYCMVIQDAEYKAELKRREEMAKLEKDVYKEQLIKIKKYISNKTLKAWEIEYGIISDKYGRLSKETVEELNLIEQMIDEVMTWEDYE